jgi:hypothetical protein
MSKGRAKPVERTPWTRAEWHNAVIWGIEWVMIAILELAAFTSIVASRTTPLYLFVPIVLASLFIVVRSFALRGWLRRVLGTQQRAAQESSGYYRIQNSYSDTQFFAPVQMPALKPSAGDSTQRFNSTEEYSRS